ncbi:sugar phosphate isomerase/epimerase family protein [Mariniflexile aquimaris]|uniref:Sugar phosphate isomerase/epimerase family protein n=1 Tax=Mariniflexile aquimaris TaxID=881009 RepID=A0ABW3BWL1_9FLAO
MAYDSMQRSPQERISMLKELGFTKYAYDWRDKHLDDTETELKLARENNIEIISVWLWLNAERDSLGRLSPSNERIFEILKAQQIKTTLWVSFSNNFFKNLTQEQSIFKASEFITFVYEKAQEIDCNIALYNHSGWFGDINNQIEIINALPQHKLTMVYNFHHAHQYLDDFPQIAQKIMPYLACVNLNGMTKDGPKISPIGSGDFEKDMIKQLRDNGFKGPWGIMGHVENKDAKSVLEQNINGLRSLITK